MLRIERVFEAWTKAEVLGRRLHGMLGWETPVADVDPRVGGRIRVVMRDPADGAERGATGEYTVVDPPHRLAFTWVWDDDPINPLIELEFSEREGEATVVMINSSIPGSSKRLAAEPRRSRADAGFTAFVFDDCTV